MCDGRLCGVSPRLTCGGLAEVSSESTQTGTTGWFSRGCQNVFGARVPVAEQTKENVLMLVTSAVSRVNTWRQTWDRWSSIHKYPPVPDGIKDLDTNIKRKEQMCLATQKVSVCIECPRSLCEMCTPSVSERTQSERTQMTNLEFMAADMLLEKKRTTYLLDD